MIFEGILKQIKNVNVAYTAFYDLVFAYHITLL